MTANIQQRTESNIHSLEESTIIQACELLRNYDGGLKEHLAHIVAELCNVSVNAMMKETKHIDVVRARWLYWYAYRYMTDESHYSIAQYCSQWRKFTSTCISHSIAKMAVIIDGNSIWAKRWIILKRLIKIMLNKNVGDEQPSNITIKITHPKGVNVELKQE